MKLARDWWGDRSPQERGWLRWGLPLASSALLVAADWLWHDRAGVTTPDDGRILLMRVGFVCAAAVAVMLIGTRRWSLQLVGVFWLLVGIAGLLIRAVGHWGPQPVPEWERDLIQSSLEVGGGLAFLGFLLWIALSRFGTHRGN